MKTVNAMFDLSGRTALVTGSSRGIGKGIAEALASAGAEVLLHARRRDATLEQTAAEIEKAGGKVRLCPGNLADPGAPARLLADAGRVDILVLNASVQSYQTIEAFTAEEFANQYAVNLRTAFELIQGALPGMIERKWGRLLAIGSVNQWKPSPRLAIYASTKAALTNLMTNCARQYARFGVTANNLAPGVIVTDRNRDVLSDDEFRDNILKQIPAERLGTAEDCAGLALLLCSDAGSYITGANIPVAGGMQI